MGYVLGVLGGSGLYQMPGLESVSEQAVRTPFGDPSDTVVRGKLGDTTLLFLPRHGRGHRVPPSAINYRANIHALKQLGATHVLSVSAVGSLKEEIAPEDLVVVDQFIDRTTKRSTSFFDEGIAAHVPMADPVCPVLAKALYEAALNKGAKIHKGGTYVCIEGPRFSTRAESFLYRSWNCSVVGMTNVPECFLAREAELPYATLALATDYDCWHSEHESVDVAAVVAVAHKNVSRAQEVIRSLAASLPDPSKSPATGAAKYATMTDVSKLNAEQRERFELLLGRYWPKG